MSWNIKDFILEVINEEQLDEKLMVYNNRKPYGQVVFLAGGAGSGKGFASKHFLDREMFKVRDVDKMKKQLQILNRLGKLDIDGILKKYGKNIPASEIENIRSIQAQGFQLRNLNLKQPNHVTALHMLVKAMGIKDSSLETLLVGKNNPETLPNIMFDITAKKVTDISGVKDLDGKKISRRVKTGSSYLSQSEKIITFGLGELNQIDSLEVEWSSGKRTALYDFDLNKDIEILE